MGYSSKLVKKIDHPYCAGLFTQEEAQAKSLRLVQAQEGMVIDGNALCFYWLVDETDGLIVDCRFQVFGHSALIGAAQAVSEMLVGKNYKQAERVHADHVDHYLRDHVDMPAFPDETSGHLNLVIDAIYSTAQQCEDIIIDHTPPSPFGHDHDQHYQNSPHPQWDVMSVKERIALIEEILDKEIRPFIALDEGGIEVMNLVDEFELIIAYQGACTSCASSTGSTLTAIQQILRERVHPQITVIPDFPDWNSHPEG
jgi:NifU-like protein